MRAGDPASAFPAALVGILLAVAGQYLLFRQRDSGLALLLLLASGMLFAREWPLPETMQPKPAPIRVNYWRWLIVAPIAVALPIVGYLSVTVRGQTNYTWGYFAGLIGLFVVAAIADIPRFRGFRLRLPRVTIARPGLEFWLVFALLAVSLFLRTWQYDIVPPSPQVDDAELAVKARDIYDGRIPVPFVTGSWRNAEFHNYFIAIFMPPFIDPLLGFMLAGAVPATAAVGLTYALVRQAYSMPVALVCAGLLSFNRWFVLMGRWGTDFPLSVALVILAIWATWKGLCTGKAIYWVTVGVACGISLIYFYLAVIAPPLVIVVWWLFRHRGALSPRDGFFGIVFAGLIALSVCLPRFAQILNEPTTVQYYIGATSVQSGQVSGAYSLLEQLSQTMLAFPYRSFGRSTHIFSPNLLVDEPAPLLDPLSGFLVTVGIGFLFYGMVRGQRWSALWFWFAILSVLVSASTRGQEAYNYRTIIMMPAFAVGGGLFLSSFLMGLGRMMPILRRATWPVAGIALSIVLGSTYRDYFVGFLQREPVWRTSQVSHVAAGRWLTAHAADLRKRLVVTTAEVAQYGPFQLTAPLGYLRRGMPFQVIQEDSLLPLPWDIPIGVERVTFLASPPPWNEPLATWAEETIQGYYPGASVERLTFPNGRPTLAVYDWPRDVLESTWGLRIEPNAVCKGGTSTIPGGWGGMIFVPDKGKYRISVANSPACVNLGLRQLNVSGNELYLAKGWHDITVVTQGGIPPELILERRDLRPDQQRPPATIVPRWHLFNGQRPLIGFETTFSDAPGAAPFDRRYLQSFDVNWGSNPPSERDNFYVEMNGVFDAPKTEEYNVSIQFNGPGTVLIDGKPVLRSEAREPKGLGERVKIEAGLHTIQIQYHALMLNPTGARFSPVGQEARRLDLRTVRPS